MTTYHFNRGNNGLIAKEDTIFGYLVFLLSLAFFAIFHILNIPSFFGGEFHFFLFEMGVFYLTLTKKNSVNFFTIFFFYAIMDFLEGSIIGGSFVAFLVSFGVVNFIYNNFLSDKTPILRFNIAFLVFLNLFIFIKVLPFYILLKASYSFEIMKFFVKSIFYSFAIFANFVLIFNKQNYL